MAAALYRRVIRSHHRRPAILRFGVFRCGISKGRWFIRCETGRQMGIRIVRRVAGVRDDDGWTEHLGGEVMDMPKIDGTLLTLLVGGVLAGIGGIWRELRVGSAAQSEAKSLPR